MTTLLSRQSASVRNADIYRDVDHRHAQQPANYRMPFDEDTYAAALKSPKGAVRLIADYAGTGAQKSSHKLAAAKREYLVTLIDGPLTTAQVIARIKPGCDASSFMAAAKLEQNGRDTISRILARMAGLGMIERISKVGAQVAIWGPL